jgi:hypothetical protein
MGDIVFEWIFKGIWWRCYRLRWEFILLTSSSDEVMNGVKHAPPSASKVQEQISEWPVRNQQVKTTIYIYLIICL